MRFKAFFLVLVSDCIALTKKLNKGLILCKFRLNSLFTLAPCIATPLFELLERIIKNCRKRKGIDFEMFIFGGFDGLKGKNPAPCSGSRQKAFKP